MAEFVRVSFQEIARMSLYDKLAVDVAKIFCFIQNADDIQIIGEVPLDELMKSILRNALPGTQRLTFPFTNTLTY